MKRFQILSFLLIGLLSAVPAYSQFNWIKNIGDLMKREKPQYENIQFWDPAIQDYRGIRAILYMVPQDFETRHVDKRLHDKMALFLANMCRDVVVLDSFDDKFRKEMVENVLVQLVDQWKRDGKIQPATFTQSLPFLNIDVVVLMERSHYDQAWKDDEKRLLIGINIGVFELDFGDPLLLDRIMADVPWFGERASYDRAEEAAVLGVADSVGAAFQRAANIINQKHDDDVRAAELAAKELVRQSAAAAKEEQKNLSDIVRNAEKYFQNITQPTALVGDIKQDVSQLKKYASVYLQLPPQERDNAKQLVDGLKGKVAQYDQWVEKKSEEDEVARQAALALQNQPKSPILTSPISGSVNQFDRVQKSGREGGSMIPSLDVNPDTLMSRYWLIPGLTQGQNIPSEPVGGTAQPVESIPVESVE